MEIQVNREAWNILQKIQGHLLKMGNKINKGNPYKLSRDEMDNRINKLGEKSIFAQSCEVLGTLVTNLVHVGGIIVATNALNKAITKVTYPAVVKLFISIPMEINKLAAKLDDPNLPEEDKKEFMKAASPLIRFCARQKYNKLTKIKERENADGIVFDYKSGKAKVYKDKDGNEFTFREDGRLIRTMSRPRAMGKDVAMDVDDLLDIAHAYMVDTYGADFEPFTYAATHNNMTTDDKKSYIIEYRNATEDQFYFICIYYNGIVLWSQFSDTSDVQIVE